MLSPLFTFCQVYSAFEIKNNSGICLSCNIATNLHKPYYFFMKKIIVTVIYWSFIYSKSQTLTLIQGERIYDHHSSTLSGMPYGYANVNVKSAYDFVNHTNIPSASTQLVDKDMVEYNGPFGNGGNCGFTSSVSNVGTYSYTGNGTTKYQLATGAIFSNINTVNDIITLYSSSSATTNINNPQAGDIYFARIRNSDRYVALKINSTSNLTATQINMLINNQPFNADVYIDFDYKYGDCTIIPTFSVVSTKSVICKGEKMTLTASGADAYLWNTATGYTTAAITVSPNTTTTYSITGTNNNGCSETSTIKLIVNTCTNIDHNSFSESGYKIYPNPTTGILNLSVNQKFTMYTISNSLGEKLITGSLENLSAVNINVSSLHPGIYFIELQDTENGFLKNRFVKE